MASHITGRYLISPASLLFADHMSPAASSHQPSRSPDPWLAVNYALLCPGLGQLYSQHRGKGWMMVGLTGGLLLFALWSIFGAAGNTIYGFWALGFLAILYSLSILDAYRGTQADYGSRITVPKGRRDVWYAVFLSQLLPGLGHLYSQQAVTGGILLVLGIGTAWLANLYPPLIPLPPTIWAFSCYHLYQTFPQRQQRQSTAIALLVLGLFITRLVVGNAPQWVNHSFIQCVVPTESMLPTLQVGDRLFVRRHTQFEPAARDIVVFQPPAALSAQRPSLDADTLFVKRIIALPGQTVEVVDQQVKVNGQPLVEPYVQSRPPYRWGPAQVPPRSYFVLGDNRNQSSDSHIWGYLPADKILGRAYKIYWPPNRIQALPGG